MNRQIQEMLLLAYRWWSQGWDLSDAQWEMLEEENPNCATREDVMRLMQRSLESLYPGVTMGSLYGR